MITNKSGSIEFTGQNAELSPRKAAVIAGLGYLIVFVISILGKSFALDKLIVLGDVETTANNMIANESLFRFGVTCLIIVILGDTLAAWGLYFLLKPTNKSLSLLAAWLWLLFVAIFGYSFVNYFSALQLFSGAEYLKVIDPNQLKAQAMLLLNTQNFAMHISFLFFGLHILVLGYLIIKSGYIPRFLGVMLITASIGYVIDSFGNFLSSSYANNTTAFIVFVGVPAVIAEFSLTLWLLFKGAKLPGLKSRVDKKVTHLSGADGGNML
jgi:hypothetical protein